MAKKPKTRDTLEALLASCSEALFPPEMGAAPVTLSSRSSTGDTPLHVLLWREELHGVQVLIAAGADVNAAGDMSETPLHIAVRKGDVAVVEALLAAGARVSARSELGQTPLELAQVQGGAIARLFANR